MPQPNGEQIRQLRIQRGITTSELAARVGFKNEGSMRNIEGSDDPTSLIKLYRIARELGVAFREIVKDDQTQSSDGSSAHTDVRP